MLNTDSKGTSSAEPRAAQRQCRASVWTEVGCVDGAALVFADKCHFMLSPSTGWHLNLASLVELLLSKILGVVLHTCVCIISSTGREHVE